jgi:peptidoglycan hydrolase CwlO-like protein
VTPESGILAVIAAIVAFFVGGKLKGGKSDAQLALTAAKNREAALQGAIRVKEADIKSLKDDITKLQADVARRQKTINNLKAELEKGFVSEGLKADEIAARFNALVVSDDD